MIASQQSARQIRAQYYRERAASLRSRMRSLAFEDVRSDLSHLATEYERLADYLQRSLEPPRSSHCAQVFPATPRHVNIGANSVPPRGEH
jgi:hypothetical protein